MGLEENLDRNGLSSRQFNLIERSNRKANNIFEKDKILVTTIIGSYIDGEFTEKIAKKYFQLEFARNRKFATRIVYLILKRGLTERRRKFLRRDHWRKSLEFSYLNGKLDKKRTKRREDSQKGSLVKNQVPWYDLPDREDFISSNYEIFIPEIAYAYNLYLDGYSHIEIAGVLNKIYHNKKEVRNENSTQKSIRRFIKRYIESNKS
ncbi:hypothetical protein HYX17_03740 [Candidatus Woesearchaeota archaeon]|nr:hypothetical protein [Candidatus Woesearchaeota archaeon]